MTLDQERHQKNSYIYFSSVNGKITRRGDKENISYRTAFKDGETRDDYST